jgi:hypothetical protein
MAEMAPGVREHGTEMIKRRGLDPDFQMASIIVNLVPWVDD